jgi:hypothetical protein
MWYIPTTPLTNDQKRCFLAAVHIKFWGTTSKVSFKDSSLFVYREVSTGKDPSTWRRKLLPPFSFACRKVKWTLVQALRFCKCLTSYRGSRGIALPFHDHDTRSWWGFSFTPRPLFTLGKNPVLIVQEAVWAPGPVWTGVENLAPIGIRCQDCPARSKSIYWLRCPAQSVYSNLLVMLRTEN